MGVVIGPAVSAGFGETRRRRYGTTRGAKIRGNPEIHHWRRRRVQDSGQPEHPPPGAAEGSEDSGRPGDSPVGTAGRCRMRGNSQPHRKMAPEKQSCGVTRSFTPGTAERMRDSGQLEAPSPAAGRSSRGGNPEARSQGDFRRVRMRGDPETHRGTAERMRDSRQLEAPLPAQPEDAGRDATRSLIGRAERDDARSEERMSSLY